MISVPYAPSSLLPIEAVALGLPINPFNKRLSMPSTVIPLNTLCLTLQLQNFESDLTQAKSESMSKKKLSVSGISPTSADDVKSTSFEQMSMSDQVMSNPNVEFHLETDDHQETLTFEETGFLEKIRINSSLSDNGKNNEGLSVLNEDKQSKKLAIEQYPHKIIKRYDCCTNKTQKVFI